MKTRGMPTSFWLLMALIQTILAVKLWFLWLDYRSMEASHAPEVLAAAHFAIPAGLRPNAIGASAVAALLWALAIWKAEPA